MLERPDEDARRVGQRLGLWEAGRAVEDDFLSFRRAQEQRRRVAVCALKLVHRQSPGINPSKENHLGYARRLV